VTAPDAFARALQIAECFERANVPYAIGGALALGIWGVPRGTVDVDVNVFVEDDRVRAVASLLRSIGVSVNDDGAAAQSVARGMFVGTWDGMRIDVFTPSIAFSHEALRTRVRKRALDIDAWYLSAESVAVFKLLFFRSKDIPDLERLVAVADVDAGYVRRWIVDMMGEDDPRVMKWDEIVAAFA
jgi:hypothetical protein